MRALKPILLVDDDNVDATTVREALEELDVANELIHIVDGAEALDYLRDGRNARPCVVLLDLNMPKMNGIEFLKVVKADPDLQTIPIIALTNSIAERDKVESFNFGAAGYIVKPTEYREVVDTMKVLNLYWTLSELPDQNVVAAQPAGN